MLRHPSLVVGKPQLPATHIQGVGVHSVAAGRSHASPAVIGGPAPFNGKNGVVIGGAVTNTKHVIGASAH